MAHLITKLDGIMSVRQTPWHGIGTILQDVATAAEAMRAANLEWTVSKRSLYTADGIPVTESNAIVRDDTETVLGVVGSGYTPMQNSEAFAFLDAVTGSGAAKYETAGSLMGGKRVWALAKLPESIQPVKNDQVDQYLLISNGHDGGAAVRVQYTPVRVVCNNTLTSALKKDGGFYYRHTGGLHGRVNEAQDILGMARTAQEQTAERYAAMAGHTPTDAEVKQVLRQLFPENDGQETDPNAEKRATVEHLFREAETCNLPGMEGTSWGLYNALTEFSDYYRRTRSNDADYRLESNWFGTGAEFKTDALQAVCEVVR